MDIDADGGSDLVPLHEVARRLAEDEGGPPLSVARIRQIEQRAIRKVRLALAKRGIHDLRDALPDRDMA